MTFEDDHSGATDSSDEPKNAKGASSGASSFQDALTRTFGENSLPDVELRDDSAADHPFERIKKLREGAGAPRRYIFKGEVGRGGMGAVLKVFDTDLRRHLAMKVVLGPGGGTAGETPVGPRQLLRFLEEAQVTGQLDHPGVVPVHELGVDEDNRVYFTMRLVRGQEFKHIIEKVHDANPDWSLTRALGVLLKVCEAMSYSHSKGVVHRDLKPANIMVGRHGQVYVMDWGLARVEGREDTHDLRLQSEPRSLTVIRTDRSDPEQADSDSPIMTMDGMVVGTPFYMPPEQAAGRVEEIGPHSDVYALGAMLYQLLSSRPPYHTPGDRVSVSVILARVLQGPPVSIHELAPNTPPELEAICEKAMARDAGSRYADMGELAEDLRAFLENRVVHAYRTGALIELKKWVRRNRTLAATLLASVSLIVLGSTSAAVVLGGKNSVIKIARDKALHAEEVALGESERALAAVGRAEEARIASEHVSDFLVSLLQTVDDETSRGRKVSVSELLDHAAQSLGDATGMDPQTTLKLRSVIGHAYYSLGLFEQSNTILEQAWQEHALLLGDEHPDTIASRYDLAILYSEQGRYLKAEQFLDRTLKDRRAFLGDGDSGTLRTQIKLAGLYIQVNRNDEAEALMLAALEQSRLSLREDHPTTLGLLHQLALVYSSQGRLLEAEETLLDVIEGRRKELGEEDERTLDSLIELGWIYLKQRKFSESEQVLAEGLRQSRAMLGEDHVVTLESETYLALLFAEQGRYEEAEPLFLEAIEMSDPSTGAFFPKRASVQSNLATLYAAQGRFKLAEAFASEALDWMLVNYDEKHPDREGTVSLLERVFLVWIPLLQRSDGPDHANTLFGLARKAAFLVRTAHFEEAEGLLVDILDRRLSTLAVGDKDTLQSFHDLAVVTALGGRLEDAEMLFMECYAERRETLGEAEPETLATLHELVRINADMGDWRSAVRLGERLLELTPEESADLDARMQLLARVHAGLGKD